MRDEKNKEEKIELDRWSKCVGVLDEQRNIEDDELVILLCFCFFREKWKQGITEKKIKGEKLTPLRKSGSYR